MSLYDTEKEKPNDGLTLMAMDEHVAQKKQQLSAGKKQQPLPSDDYINVSK